MPRIYRVKLSRLAAPAATVELGVTANTRKSAGAVALRALATTGATISEYGVTDVTFMWSTERNDDDEAE